MRTRLDRSDRGRRAIAHGPRGRFHGDRARFHVAKSPSCRLQQPALGGPQASSPDRPRRQRRAFGPGQRLRASSARTRRARSFPRSRAAGRGTACGSPDTETGWVHASLCKELDDLSGLEFRPNLRLYSRTGSYVLSGYSGAYAFDRKSNSVVLGGRARLLRVRPHPGGSGRLVDARASPGGDRGVVVRPHARVRGLPHAVLPDERRLGAAARAARWCPTWAPAWARPCCSAAASRRSTSAQAPSSSSPSARRCAGRCATTASSNHTSADSGTNNNIEFTLGSEFLF